MTTEIITAFFTDELGSCTFEPVTGQEPLVGYQVIGSKKNPQKIPCFSIGGNLDRAAYKRVCNADSEGATQKMRPWLFLGGYELIQSPRFRVQRFCNIPYSYI
jgi:hypothetical protein